MNKRTDISTEKPKTTEKIKRLLQGKWKEIILIIVLAIALIFAAWQIFRKDDKTSKKETATLTQSEIKVARILEEIEGVGEANVMVCETEEGVKSVVVVCDGANNFGVVMDIREAVAAALGTEEKAIKVYLKKE